MPDFAYRLTKRALDIVVSGCALLLLLPVLIGILLLVRRDLGSPVLFRHTRAGRHGVPFPVLKIRTMRPPRTGEDMYASDADRLTPLGRRLRSWSLDEIPQLLNVLRGHMSLVGPRPLPLEYLRRYTPEQRRRLKVRPGITGLAQVNGRNAISWDDRLALDAQYVKTASLLLDLRILADTLLIVLRRSGISAEGHATMPELQRARLIASSVVAGADRLVARPATAAWRRVGPAVVIAVRDDVEPQLLAGMGAMLWEHLDRPRRRSELIALLGVDTSSDDARQVVTALDQLGEAGILVAA